MSDEITVGVENAATEEQETTSTAEAQSAGAEVANEGEDEQEQGEKKRLGGWQRKIRKLEEQNEMLMDLLRKGGTKSAEPTKEEAEEKPPIRPVRPKESDFDTYEKYQIALDKYESERDEYHEKLSEYKIKKAVEADRKERETKSEQSKVQEGWAAQCAEARKSHSDFYEVINNPDVPVTQAMADAIVTSESGAEIAYYLGTHPEEAERISELSPVAAVRAIGQLEARLAGESKESEETPKKEAAPPAQAKAPKPPKPVKKPSPTAVVDLNDPNVPMDVWLRERNKQVFG